MSYKHLKERGYYERLYDSHTIEECERYTLPFPKDHPKVASVKNAEAEWGRVVRIILWSIKGERYLEKEKTIQKWIEKNRERDEHYERVHMSKNCDLCGREMELEHKSLNLSFEKNKKDYVEFVFACLVCKKIRIFHENGRERFIEPHLCPECGNELKTDIRDEKNQTVYQDYCKSCPWKESEPLVIQSKDETSQAEEEKEFLRKRNLFCLDEKEGEEYRRAKENLEEFRRLVDRQKEEETEGTLRNKLKKLEKLNLAQLKKKLNVAFEKKNFRHLELQVPTQDKADLIVSFSLQDEDPDRAAYDSQKTLKNLTSKSLSSTNWTLMTEGIHYKMGMLTGRLRGMETEERLLELIRKREKKTS